MTVITSIAHVAFFVFTAVFLLNLCILTHELGHLLAAKWRGLQVDKFQIWFGKPIWQTKIRGVQYGLGWIPFGGYVAISQMDSYTRSKENPIADSPTSNVTPLDRIIVAIAGPLFSVLLALVFALSVWIVGKPNDMIQDQTIGWVESGSPAEKAGLLPGDEVLKVNEKPVDGFAGKINSVFQSIVFSSGKLVSLTVARPGVHTPITVLSEYKISETNKFQRKGIRCIGIFAASPDIVVSKLTPNSPAAERGIEKGDRITRLNGKPLFHPLQLRDQFLSHPNELVCLTIVKPDKSTREISLKPVKTQSPSDTPPHVGFSLLKIKPVDHSLIHPSPLLQMKESCAIIWITTKCIVIRNSGIRLEHLGGPISMTTMLYKFLSHEDGWRRALVIMVILNMNLALLNMLPIPILDGGHVALAIYEIIFGRPPAAKVMNGIEVGFVLTIGCLALFIAVKDIGDLIFSYKPANNPILRYADTPL